MLPADDTAWNPFFRVGTNGRRGWRDPPPWAFPGR